MIDPHRRQSKSSTSDVQDSLRSADKGSLIVNDLPINLFDAAVYLGVIVAVVSGLRTGLLRSLATIFGYLAAAPVAVIVSPYVTPFFVALLKVAPAQTGLIYAAVFLVIGFILGFLLRLAVAEIAGDNISAADRAAGAMLGAVRVILLAVLLVVIFDRLIPAGQEPAFLAGSRLRPVLSQAGQAGLKSLPSDIADTIDRIKKQRGL